MLINIYFYIFFDICVAKQKGAISVAPICTLWV